MAGSGDTIEPIVRSRLRGMRHALGWSLDDLATRSNLSASTISRIETGKRTISLDVLQALARALQTDLNVLLDVSDADDDVVIRPTPAVSDGRTTWPLTRDKPESRFFAAKQRIEPTPTCSDLKVHPGYDWFFVLSGAVLLRLDTREIIVHEGEAAEFSTMIPHGFSAHAGPAEILTIFDREGQRAHPINTMPPAVPYGETMPGASDGIAGA